MRKDLLVTLILSLIVGFGGGYLLNNSQDSTDHSHDDASEMDDSHTTAMSHDHPMFNVESEKAPTISFTAVEDAKSGYNITISTENFTFTPEKVNTDNVAGEGHAHLYVDGVKVARIYSTNYHYDGNFDGTKTFKVTLNANDHSEYALNGDVISSEAQVTHEMHE